MKLKPFHDLLLNSFRKFYVDFLWWSAGTVMFPTRWSPRQKHSVRTKLFSAPSSIPALNLSVRRHSWELKCFITLCLDLHHTTRRNVNLAQKYFSQLDLETFQALCEMYRVDLEMFDYRTEDYYQYVMWCDLPCDKNSV